MSNKGNDTTILAFDLAVKLPAGPQSEELVTVTVPATDSCNSSEVHEWQSSLSDQWREYRNRATPCKKKIKQNPIHRKWQPPKRLRPSRSLTALCRSGAPGSRCWSVLCQFAEVRWAGGGLPGGRRWVGWWVSSRCGCGCAVWLRCSGRWCRSPLWVREKASGRPRAYPPLLLSCFRCRCARLCTPEEEMETLMRGF